MFSISTYPPHVQEVCSNIDTIANQLKGSAAPCPENQFQPSPIDPFTSPHFPAALYNSSTTPQLYSRHSSQQVHPLHSPLKWRELGASYGLTQLDCPPELRSQLFESDSSSESRQPQQLKILPDTFSLLDLTYVYEYIGRTSLNLRDCVGLGHGRILLLYLKYWEDDCKVKNSYFYSVLRQLVLGQAYIAISVTEPHSGSDVMGISSYCEPVLENNSITGFVLNGSKEFNARLHQASDVILFVKSQKNSSSMNAFCIPLKEYLERYGTDASNDNLNKPLNPSDPNTNNDSVDSADISSSSSPKARFEIHSTPCYGLHGNSFGGLTFENIFVPKEYLIDDIGFGGIMFRSHFSYWRLFQIACAIGTTEQALLDVVEYIRSRTVFGDKSLASFSHIQQDLAQFTSQLRMGQLLVRDIAQKLDSGDLDSSALSYLAMGKSEVVDSCLKTCLGIQQILGARGYTLYHSDIGQRILDLQGLSIADGASALMRSLVMRYTFGEDMWTSVLGKSALDFVDLSPEEQHHSPQPNSHPLTPQRSHLPSSSPLVVIQPSHFQSIQHLSLSHSEILLNMGQYQDKVCVPGGGSCPTVCIVNCMNLFLFSIFKNLQAQRLITQLPAINPLFNLEHLLGIIYPQTHILRPDFHHSINQDSTALSSHHTQARTTFVNFPYNADTFSFLPYQPFIQTDQFHFHSFYRFLQPATQHTDPTSSTNANEPSECSHVYFPYFTIHRAPTVGTQDASQITTSPPTLRPNLNIFTHGRLTNEQVLWYLHSTLIPTMTAVNEALNYPPDLTNMNKATRLGYFINCQTVIPLYQHCLDIYPPRDNNITIYPFHYESSSQEPNDNAKNANSHKHENQPHTLRLASIDCECFYSTPSTSPSRPPRRNQPTLQPGEKKLSSLFKPLYPRPLTFSQPSNRHLPDGFDSFNPFHNTYLTNVDTMSITEFFTLCSPPLPSSLFTDNPNIQPEVDQTNITIVSFNWLQYSINSTASPSPSSSTSSPPTPCDHLETTATFHKSNNFDKIFPGYTLFGRHFIVIKQMQWITDHSEPQSQNPTSHRLLITACDPARPQKDYFFVASEFVYVDPLSKKRVSAITLTVKGAGKASGDAIRVVNSIYSISTIHLSNNQ